MPYKDPEVQRERKRAYAQKPEVRERQRALKSDLAHLMKRLELDASGIAAIMESVRGGQKYIEIAEDWLIDEGDVSAIAVAHGVFRRPRRTISMQGKPCSTASPA